MEARSPNLPTTLQPTSPRTAELDRLGDEIAELSAHLDAATVRLLTLIREFDARGGWNTGFHSCAACWGSGRTWAGQSACCTRSPRATCDPFHHQMDEARRRERPDRPFLRSILGKHYPESLRPRTS